MTTAAGSGTLVAGTEPAPSAQQNKVLAGLAGSLDRSLPVSLNTQLRGLIEFGIALGDLPAGQRLPSVRELASHAGVAPMTVATVYRELRLAGLIEARGGSGTYVGDGHSSDGLRSVSLRQLQRRIDALFNEAQASGLAPSLVASLVNARVARGRFSRAIRILMIGNFLDTTKQYATRIREHLNMGDTIEATTVKALAESIGDPFSFDLCVTLAHRRGEVEALLPKGTPVVGLSFIPAEETRALLAVVDPMARIGIVSVFPEFMALMKPGVLRFTPHVADAEVRLITAPDLKPFILTLDVLVYASGAEAILKDLPAGKQAIEFRYVPDPHAIRQTLVPAIEKLRTENATKEANAHENF